MRADETVYSRFAATARRWPERPFLYVLEETARAYDIPAGPFSYGAALAEVDERTGRATSVEGLFLRLPAEEP